jgi:hypothetical protein
MASEKFDYLFELPYELIIQVVSQLSLKDTDTFCYRLTKEVEYGEGKLKLKDLCEDIWKIKYVASYGSPKENVENWREKYMSTYVQNFVRTVSNYIDEIDNRIGDQKLVVFFEMYEYILQNKEILQLEDRKLRNFENIVFERLMEVLSDPYQQKYEDLTLYYLEAIFGKEALPSNQISKLFMNE